MAVDIGNTQTVLGVVEGEDLRERWRVTMEANRAADEVDVYPGPQAIRALLAVSEASLGVR